MDGSPSGQCIIPALARQLLKSLLKSRSRRIAVGDTPPECANIFYVLAGDRGGERKAEDYLGAVSRSNVLIFANSSRADLYVGHSNIWIEATSQYRER
jgi:hypothetical protein